MSLSVLPEFQTVQLLVIDAPTVVSASLTIRLAVENGPAEDVVVEAFVPRGLGNVQALPRPDFAFSVPGTTMTWRLPSVSDGDELQVTTYADSTTSTEGDHVVTAAITQGPCTGDGCTSQAVVRVVWYVAPVYVLDLMATPGDVVAPATVAFSLRLNCMMPIGQRLAVHASVPPSLGAPTSISGGGTYNPGAHTVSWEQFACGSVESFTIEIGTDVTPGSYTVTAALDGSCATCPAAQATLTVGSAPSASPIPTVAPTAAPTPAPVDPQPTLPPTLPPTDTESGVGAGP